MNKDNPFVAFADIRGNWPIVQIGVESRYFSSFDRAGGNDDGFEGTYSALYEDEKGEHVIFDAEGPGCLRTLWFTSDSGGYSSLSAGLVRFYFDGEETPRLVVEANELYKGTAAPFLKPLVADNHTSTGGFACWVPLAYKESLRITTENRAFFYIAQYDTFPVDTAISSWTAAADVSPAQTAFLDAGPSRLECAPVANPCEQNGAGVIDCLRFVPSRKPAKEELQAARIRIWWDGDAEPAVDCPLGAFFGSGLYEAEVRALGFAMHGGDYENRFPMPFWNGFRIAVEGMEGELSVHVSPQRYDRSTSGRFRAAFRKEHPTTLGRDFTMLEAHGAGKLVGTVLVIEPDTPADKSWWEGDLRSYTNGKRTPALHGTGHEDDHLGGWSNEFLDTPFTLPMHGEPAVEMQTKDGIYNGNCSLYRLWPGVNYVDGIRHSVEHGNENVKNYNYACAAFWYESASWRLKETDRFDPCDDASRSAHAVTVQNESDVVELASTFEGRGYKDEVTMKHRSHLNRMSFRAALDLGNQGVYLRRAYDQFHGRQRARVLVDGEFVGYWYTPEENRACRWAEREFFVPAKFVAGKRSVEITVDPPASTPLWDAAEYRVLCVLKG